MAYCTKDDLLTGDIPLAGKYGDGTSFCNFAADEIDGQIGHLYETPVAFEDPSDPANRPALLLLKKINILIASGRIILDMAAGGEDDNLHAYGRSMLSEGIGLLKSIQNGKIELFGAVRIDAADGDNTGPSIVQEDPYSLVQGFYDLYSRPYVFPGPPAMRPYDDPPSEVAAG